MSAENTAYKNAIEAGGRSMLVWYKVDQKTNFKRR